MEGIPIWLHRRHISLITWKAFQSGSMEGILDCVERKYSSLKHGSIPAVVHRRLFRLFMKSKQPATEDAWKAHRCKYQPGDVEGISVWELRRYSSLGTWMVYRSGYMEDTPVGGTWKVYKSDYMEGISVWEQGINTSLGTWKAF